MDIKSFEELVLAVNVSDEQLIEKLQNVHLLKTIKRCTQKNCKNICILKQRSNSFLNHIFFCKKCSCQYSLSKGTYFENSHLVVKHILYSIWLWASETRSGVASNLTNISRNTIYQQYRFLRDICSWKLLQNLDLCRIGGQNHIVQIDECAITNVGRVVKEKWILGMYDVQKKKGVIVYVEKRDSATLLEEIQKHVKVGSDIWTDCWKGYTALDNFQGVSPYTHKTVNYSMNFVDPTTGTCTNMVESYWAQLKTYLRRLGVLSSQLLPEHIDQFMWKQHFGPTTADRYKNIITHITEKYPN